MHKSCFMLTWKDLRMTLNVCSQKNSCGENHIHFVVFSPQQWAVLALQNAEHICESDWRKHFKSNFIRHNPPPFSIDIDDLILVGWNFQSHLIYLSHQSTMRNSSEWVVKNHIMWKSGEIEKRENGTVWRLEGWCRCLMGSVDSRVALPFHVHWRRRTRKPLVQEL